VEKNQFYNLLTNYTSLTTEETNELISLQSQFPYSQVIHGIAARGAQDNKFANKDHHLHLSAIYSTDRTVLKSIMTSLQQARKLPKVVEVAKPVVKEVGKTQPEIISTPALKNKQPEINKAVLIDTDVDDSFYKEFEHDLETLVERKHQFDEAVNNYEKGLSNNIEESKPKKIRSVSDPEDGLLKEIKTTKKKIKPEDPKQKEQIDIINQFIKTQPTITKNKLAAQEANTQKGDLIEKELTYGENIVSETLVEILLKQGKKEKAIEVLKKLIWKFPQKKAYFAAQIEDLKK
jgi:tetratricopeptide (TPR) repeat protein